MEGSFFTGGRPTLSDPVCPILAVVRSGALGKEL
jgi:hypothetical protein